MTNEVLRMMLATSKVMDVHLLTSSPLRGGLAAELTEQYGIKIHQVELSEGNNPLRYIEYNKYVRVRIEECHPHIVHVHGAWDAKAAIVQRCARKMKLVTIVSPHRGLAPEIINIDFWKSRLWKLLLYQIQMISRSTAVAAINDKEREDILGLGLKRRIEIIPAMANQNSGELCAALTETYRKALDSSYRLFLLDDERKFLDASVRTAIADEDVRTEMPSLNGLSFRRISFLAFDEDATEIMQRGAEKAGMYLPQEINVAQLPRYKNKNAKALRSLEEMAKTVNVSHMPENQLEERRAVQLIVQVRTMGLKRMTLRNWVELYDLFRNRDFNEDIVGEELRHRRLKRFTKRLQKDLKSRFELKEGYVIFQ